MNKDKFKKEPVVISNRMQPICSLCKCDLVLNIQYDCCPHCGAEFKVLVKDDVSNCTDCNYLTFVNTVKGMVVICGLEKPKESEGETHFLTCPSTGINKKCPLKKG